MMLMTEMRFESHGRLGERVYLSHTNRTRNWRSVEIEGVVKSDSFGLLEGR